MCRASASVGQAIHTQGDSRLAEPEPTEVAAVRADRKCRRLEPLAVDPWGLDPQELDPQGLVPQALWNRLSLGLQAHWLVELQAPDRRRAPTRHSRAPGSVAEQVAGLAPEPSRK